MSLSGAIRAGKWSVTGSRRRPVLLPAARTVFEVEVRGCAPTLDVERDHTPPVLVAFKAGGISSFPSKLP
ncbi:hypothetical protein D3C86_1075500 [compost metagenome]